eukprot:scaffold964_cov170-Amphora_coffeaeformis.AAC.2
MKIGQRTIDSRHLFGGGTNKTAGSGGKCDNLALNPAQHDSTIVRVKQWYHTSDFIIHKLQVVRRSKREYVGSKLVVSLKREPSRYGTRHEGVMNELGRSKKKVLGVSDGFVIAKPRRDRPALQLFGGEVVLKAKRVDSDPSSIFRDA